MSRPSNGSEGESFMAAFCAQCKHDQDIENPCQIIGATMAFNIGEKGYPKEWVCEDDLSRPRCTAWEPVGSPDKIRRCEKTEDMFK